MRQRTAGEPGGSPPDGRGAIAAIPAPRPAGRTAVMVDVSGALSPPVPAAAAGEPVIEDREALAAVRELSRGGSPRPASILAELVRVAARTLPCDLAVAHCPGVPVQARRGGVGGAAVSDPALDALMNELWKQQQTRQGAALRLMGAGGAERPGHSGRLRRSRDIVPIGMVGLLLLVHSAERTTRTPGQRRAVASLLAEVTDAQLQRARRDPVTGLANRLGWEEACRRAQRAAERGEPAGIVHLELDTDTGAVAAVAPGAAGPGRSPAVLLDMGRGGASALLLDLAGDGDDPAAGRGEPGRLLTEEAAAELRRVADLVSRAIRPEGLAARTDDRRIAVLVRGAGEATTRAVAAGLRARLAGGAAVGLAWIPPDGSVRAADELAGERLRQDTVSRARRRRASAVTIRRGLTIEDSMTA